MKRLTKGMLFGMLTGLIGVILGLTPLGAESLA
jgi:hypothetical protein